MYCWFLNFLFLTNRKLQQLHNAKVRQHVRNGDRCTLEVTLNGGGKAGHLEWILGFRHEPNTISLCLGCYFLSGLLN